MAFIRLLNTKHEVLASIHLQTPPPPRTAHRVLQPHAARRVPGCRYYNFWRDSPVRSAFGGMLPFDRDWGFAITVND